MRQSDVNELLRTTTSVRVYDPESAMREALNLKMVLWLSNQRFDSTILQDLRRITRSIMGLPRDLVLHRLPAELDALHCVHFNAVSPVTRKGAILSYLEQMGINMQTGPDLFGNDHWCQLIISLERICGMPLKDELAVMHIGEQICTTDQWVVTSIMSQLEEVFAGETFNPECLQRVANALEALAAGKVHVDEDSQLVRQAWYGLYAQEGVRFDAMAPAVRASFKEAVLAALCLNQSSVSRILGAQAWTEICALEIQAIEHAVQAEMSSQPSKKSPRYKQSGSTWLTRIQQLFAF